MFSPVASLFKRVLDGGGDKDKGNSQQMQTNGHNRQDSKDNNKDKDNKDIKDKDKEKEKRKANFPTSFSFSSSSVSSSSSVPTLSSTPPLPLSSVPSSSSSSSSSLRLPPSLSDASIFSIGNSPNSAVTSNFILQNLIMEDIKHNDISQILNIPSSSSMTHSQSNGQISSNVPQSPRASLKGNSTIPHQHLLPSIPPHRTEFDDLVHFLLSDNVFSLVKSLVSLNDFLGDRPDGIFLFFLCAAVRKALPKALEIFAIEGKFIDFSLEFRRELHRPIGFPLGIPTEKRWAPFDILKFLRQTDSMEFIGDTRGGNSIQRTLDEQTNIQIHMERLLYLMDFYLKSVGEDPNSPMAPLLMSRIFHHSWHFHSEIIPSASFESLETLCVLFDPSHSPLYRFCVSSSSTIVVTELSESPKGSPRRTKKSERIRPVALRVIIIECYIKILIRMQGILWKSDDPQSVSDWRLLQSELFSVFSSHLGSFRLPFVLTFAENFSHWTAVAKLFEMNRRWADAMRAEIRQIEENFHRGKPIDFPSFCSLIASHLCEVPSTEEQKSLLEGFLRLFKRMGGPLDLLESAIQQKFSHLSSPLSALLFSEDFSPSEFPEFSPKIFFRLIGEHCKIMNSLKGADAFQTAAPADTWREIAKNVATLSAAPSGGPLKVSVTIENPPPFSSLVVFSCGHAFPIKEFVDSTISEFVLRLRSLNLPITLTFLLSEFSEIAARHADSQRAQRADGGPAVTLPCPPCVFNAIRSAMISEEDRENPKDSQKSLLNQMISKRAMHFTQQFETTPPAEIPKGKGIMATANMGGDIKGISPQSGSPQSGSPPNLQLISPSSSPPNMNYFGGTQNNGNSNGAKFAVSGNLIVPKGIQNTQNTHNTQTSHITHTIHNNYGMGNKK